MSRWLPVSSALARAGEVIRNAHSPGALILALDQAARGGAFSFIAVEFTDAGEDLVRCGTVPLQANNRSAREYAVAAGGKSVWLFSQSDATIDTSGSGNHSSAVGAVRYSLPLPADDGSLGMLVCELPFDGTHEPPSSDDVRAHLAQAIEHAFALIAAARR